MSKFIEDVDALIADRTAAEARTDAQTYEDTDQFNQHLDRLCAHDASTADEKAAMARSVIAFEGSDGQLEAAF